MLTKPIPEFFRGPLGSHRNYIAHIALQNCVEYFRCKAAHEGQGQFATPAKYAQLRLFLNALDSLNNVPEYLYSEHGPLAKAKDLRKFLKAVRASFPILGQLAELANAYKHCGRWHDRQMHARGLQKTLLSVQLVVGQGVSASAEFNFLGPLPEHEKILNEAFGFWLDYNNTPTKLNEFLNL